MRRLPRRLQTSQRLNRATVFGDAGQCAGRGCGEHNVPIVGPGTASRICADVAKRDWRAAVNGYLLQLSVGKESDPPPIWRKERLLSVFGTAQKIRLLLIEDSKRQDRFSFCSARGEHNSTGVGGEGKNVEYRRDRLRPEIYAELNERLVLRARGAPGEHDCRSCDGH